MNADDLDALMRAGEVYHNLRVPPGCWTIVRVDGRSFTALTKKHYVHPFDERFHLAMVAAAVHPRRCPRRDTQRRDFSAAAARLDLLRPQGREDDLRRRRRRKRRVHAARRRLRRAALDRGDRRAGRRLLPVAPGRCPARRAQQYGLLDAAPRGQDRTPATSALHRKGVDFKNELLFQQGVNFSKTPVWQRRRTILHWERHETFGHNPLTGEDVTALRRRIRIDGEPPAGDEYSTLLQRLLAV